MNKEYVYEVSDVIRYRDGGANCLVTVYDEYGYKVSSCVITFFKNKPNWQPHQVREWVRKYKVNLMKVKSVALY